MNQITNILSGLKKRKASAPPEAAPADAARPAKKPARAILVGMLALLAISAAGGWWFLLRAKPAAPIKVAHVPSKPIAVPQQPITQPEAHPENVTTEKMPPQEPPKPVAEVPPAVQPKEDGSKEASGGKEASKEAALRKEDLHKDSAPAKEAVVMPPKEVAPVAKAKASKEAPAPTPAAEKEQKKEEAAPEQAASVPVEVPPKPHVAASKPKRSKAPPQLPVAEEKPQAGEAMAGSVPTGDVDKQVKQLTPQQQANNEFIRANGMVQQGSIKEAIAGYETVLQLDPGHEAARQAMVVLLLQGKRNADAERTLQEGLKQNIKNSGFAMLLARIQLDRDAPWSALLTLQKSLPYAAQQADYQAFVAALLQRLNHHKEAVAHYQAAVALSPDTGVWWMGMGISLRAMQKTEESRAAFRRALDTHTLSSELQSFVNRQLREL